MGKFTATAAAGGRARAGHCHGFLDFTAWIEINSGRMARRSHALIPLNRLEARTRACERLARLGFVAMCLSVGFVVVATAFPQRRELAEMERRLAEIRQDEVRLRAERDDFRAEHQALREDSAFLETQARDRLGYFREGERVLRIEEESR